MRQRNLDSGVCARARRTSRDHEDRDQGDAKETKKPQRWQVKPMGQTFCAFWGSMVPLTPSGPTSSLQNYGMINSHFLSFSVFGNLLWQPVNTYKDAMRQIEEVVTSYLKFQGLQETLPRAAEGCSSWEPAM